MEIKKLEINKQSFDINLKFYYFLKYLVKLKLTHNQATTILAIYQLNKKQEYETVLELILNGEHKLKGKKLAALTRLLAEVSTSTELELFVFSIKLYLIKDLLLQEAKVRNLLDVSRLDDLDPLSLEYDRITVYSPYSTRVSGALLSLLFFERLENGDLNFISKNAEDLVKSMSANFASLRSKGVEANQIFMLMFSESINQSIISDSGSNYEDRIMSVLLSIGIPKEDISKVHDKDDSSTEFDFFFEIGKKTYGIGAKRTLRERYKQFIKTAQMSEIDVMIEITLGLDLPKDKALSIRNHNVYIFLADEVYQNRKDLQEIEGVFSVKELTMSTLKQLQ